MRDFARTEALPWRFLLGDKAFLPPGFLVGSAQDHAAATGCTVICCPGGAVGGVALRGGAPATRETDVLACENTVQEIHAVMLSGGSAFGLDAAAGAVRWLGERSVGFALAGHHVPVVCGASLFDLTLGTTLAPPDAAMGYAACEAASEHILNGNLGAGTGASVGKLLGGEYAMKAGLGAAGVATGGLIVTALVALNALGAVFERSTGTWLAGVRDPANPQRILPPYAALALATQAQATSEGNAEGAAQQAGNTTLACVMTNASLTKPSMTRVASMAHDGFARAIEPVHTSLDGDIIFALSRGEGVEGRVDQPPCSPAASADLVGILAALAVEYAVHDAALSVEGAYGLPAARDLLRTAHD
jgi:L-aminopeptidase/D-esterase-like protein